jgi:hypothetical protein
MALHNTKKSGKYPLDLLLLREATDLSANLSMLLISRVWVTLAPATHFGVSGNVVFGL